MILAEEITRNNAISKLFKTMKFNFYVWNGIIFVPSILRYRVDNRLIDHPTVVNVNRLEGWNQLLITKMERATMFVNNLSQ